MNDKKKFSININYNLIQSIRLVQSLHEANDNLIINKIHKKFKTIEKYFDLKFNYNVKNFMIFHLISNILIVHPYKNWKYSKNINFSS